jgi:ParB family chromosome partitioning protein
LTASIREKGVLEPILVRNIGPNRYQIISGERRYRAATMAGLDEIPAIEFDVDDKETLEIALIENIQRKDLTPFEEAEGLAVLQEKFGYTHDRISQVIGKSRTTVTETLLINDIPDRIRAMCREAGISNKSVLVQVARAGSGTSSRRCGRVDVCPMAPPGSTSISTTPRTRTAGGYVRAQAARSASFRTRLPASTSSCRARATG